MTFVDVECGITIAGVNSALDRRGLALINMDAHTAQTVVGATNYAAAYSSELALALDDNSYIIRTPGCRRHCVSFFRLTRRGGSTGLLTPDHSGSGHKAEPGLQEWTRGTAHRRRPCHNARSLGSLATAHKAGRLAIWLGLALGLALGPMLLPAPALAQKVGKGSCVGTDACTGNTGNVKNDACFNNTGAVGNNACDGNAACALNTGATIGNSACVGFEACLNNSGTIGPHQCIGDQVCKNNTANIP